MCDIKNKIKNAKESIVLIDNFVDEMTISVLENKNDDVAVLVCSKNRLMVKERNVRRRKCFKSGFNFVETTAFRNMYMLIDGKFLYLLSRPLRYNEKRGFWYIQMMDIDGISRVREKVLEGKGRVKNLYRHF